MTKRTININALLRDNIKNIKPYSSARDEYTGAASIFLDANENPHGAVDGSANNRYPDPYQQALKDVVSKIKKIGKEHIFLGNGSDEAIELLYKAFCTPGKDKAIISSPTYGMYQVCADTNDVDCIDIKLTNGFQLDVAGILQAQNEKTKLLWICSPNNPSGNLLSCHDIETLLNNFNGIVIVDEAYIDFTDAPSWIEKIDLYPNLVVIQTFSKAWGLANIRLGMMFASKEIISVINKIKMPYNINGIIQHYAAVILKDGEKNKDEMVANIISERKRLNSELSAIPCITKIYPSDSNFFLVQTTNPKEIYDYLVTRGIVTRDRSKLHLCEGGIRITIGTKQENDILLEELRRL